jgi:hypothetical protein
MSAHKFDYSMGPDAKLVICFDYDKGDPGCHTQRNGDPGWPPEPEACEVTDVRVWKRTDGQWVDTGVSLGEDVTDNKRMEALCFEHIESQREEMQERDNSEEADWYAELERGYAKDRI